MKFKMAVAQPRFRDVEKNLSEAESLVRKAAKGESRLIVFPEYFVEGPLLSYDNLKPGRLKYLLDFFKDLAVAYEIDIVPGSFAEPVIVGKQRKAVYNSAYYIDFRGRIRAKYRKIHLWKSERKLMVAGNEISVFNTRFGKTGLAICWDLAFPELFRAMARRGARLVVVPAFWIQERPFPEIGYDSFSEARFIDSLCQARAFENGMFLAFSNFTGSVVIGSRKLNFAGHSQICMPFKGAVEKLSRKEGLAMAELDDRLLGYAEKAYWIRRDLRAMP